jgi:hypothetical protein
MSEVFEVTVFNLLKNKKTKIHSTTLVADNHVQALERSCVRWSPHRLVEIRQILEVPRPPINRAERDGVI